MKSALIYKHGQLTQVGCCRLLNPRYAAITAAIYTLNISIFVVLLYSWRIGVNIKRFTTLEDVYYGVQIAYLAIIGTHLFMILLSIVLLIGIYRTPINVMWLLVKRNRILSVPDIIRAKAFDLEIFRESRPVVEKEIARLKLINGMQILILVSSWLTYLPWSEDEYDWEVALYFIRNNISKDQQTAWMIALYVTSTPFFYNTIATMNVYLYNIGHLVLQHQFLNFFINQSHEIADQKSIDAHLKGCVKVHLLIKSLKKMLILPDGLILLALFMVTSLGFGFCVFFLYLSEENYTNACAMPWENWNVDNRKSYLIFLMGIRQPNTLSVFNLHLSNEIVLKENISLIIPWVIGFITFMALEAVSMVYSNVLRDHVNKEFDALCKAEVAFFISRVFINMLAIGGVMRFCNLLRAGISWKGPEVIEL